MRSDNHMTPLHLATLEGHIEVMKLLLEHGVQKDKATANDTGHPVAACFQMFSYKPLFEVNSEKNFECELVFFPSLWTPPKKKQKATLGALGFCTFYFFTCFSTLFFSLLKFLDLYQNRKINPVRRILGKSIQDCFCVQYFFVFVQVFCCPKPNCPKSRGKPKKNKKNNPVRRILGKSIQDWFFWFIWFFSRFLLSQTQLSKNSRKTKKNKKNNPVRRILGKSIQDWFFLGGVYLVFLEVFAVPSPTVQKLEENQKKQKKQSCEKNLG